MKQKLYLLIVCLMSCVTAWAQDDQPSWSIENSTISLVADKDDKVVEDKDGNTFHLPANAEEVNVQIQFNLKLTIPESNSEVNPDDVTKPVLIWVKWGDIDMPSSFTPVFEKIDGEDLLWSCTKEISLSLANVETVKDITFYCSLDGNNFYAVNKIVRIWPAPTATMPEQKDFNIYNIVNQSFTINKNGGYADGWSITWKVDDNEEEESQNKDTYNFNYENKGSDLVTRTVSVTVTNSCGDKVWYESEAYSCKITVYPEEKFTQNREKYSTFEERSVEFSISDDFYKDYLTYNWTVDGKEISNVRANYSFDAPQIEGDNDIIQHTYSVNYSYSNNGVEFSGSKDFYLTVYDIPEFETYINVNENENNIEDDIVRVIPGDTVKLIAIAKNYKNWEGDKPTFQNTWTTASNNKIDGLEYNLGIVENGNNEEVESVYEFKSSAKLSDTINVDFTYKKKIIVRPKLISRFKRNKDKIYPGAEIKMEAIPSDNYEADKFEYQWSDADGNPISSTENSLTLKDSVTMDSGDRSYYLRVYYKDGVKKYRINDADSVYKFEFTIFDEPKIDSISNNNSSMAISNIKTTHEISCSGGNESKGAWTYAIESQGKYMKATVDTDTDGRVRVSYENPNNDQIAKEGFNDTIFVKAINSYDGDFREVKDTLTAKIFSKASAEWASIPEENYFYGDKVILKIDTIGGIPGNWEFKWSVNKEEVKDDNVKDSLTYTIPSISDKGSENYTVSVDFKNYVVVNDNSEEIFSFKDSKKFTAWRKGECSGIKYDGVESEDSKYHVYAGSRSSSRLFVETQYGYENGWTYEWSEAGKVLSNSDSFDVPINDIDSDSKDYAYVVKVKNAIGDNVSLNDTKNITITKWRKAEMPNSISIKDKTGKEVTAGLREGNQLKISVDQAKYGYKPSTNWHYQWIENNVQINPESPLSFDRTVPNAPVSGEAMSSSTVIYKLELQNVGPNGKNWAGQTYTKQFTVYRKPKTPTKLIRKGSVSRTLIAYTSLSDQQLAENQYYLVFGIYDPSTGYVQVIREQQQLSPGQTRWATQIPAEQYNNDNLCVYALWKYSDGANVASGLCFLEGSDEMWDGSNYDNVTRGSDPLGIDEHVSDTSTCTAPLQYYGMGGVPSSTMKRGLNIVKMKDGSIRKVIIK